MLPVNDTQRKKDAEELWRYRLSMDEQLTQRPIAEGLRRFRNRYTKYKEEEQQCPAEKS
jgi:hypothetical protein